MDFVLACGCLVGLLLLVWGVALFTLEAFRCGANLEQAGE